MLVIHGGAGTITRNAMTPEAEKQYREKLTETLQTGHGVLSSGGSSLDAVEAAIKVMEDSPLFNAGKGSVFTRDGRNEMDAAIMDGKTMKAGAVAGVTIVKNPISAARAVMEKSEHVMLIGRGAEHFATRAGLEIVAPSYFWTERRWKAQHEQKHGTVGCVALDHEGNLAAGTSTGGISNQQYGRVGDSPIIGAGTYANDLVAISATGAGEFFIRYTVAHDIAALMKYKAMSVEAAAGEVINHKLKVIPGAEGGVIALDRNGNFAMPFNTEGMYRGWVGSDGAPHVAIW